MTARSKPAGEKAKAPKGTAPGRRDAGRPRGEPILEAVLDRTLEELAAVGIGQLSVDRIARAAEVNKTSVYRRWPTREALVSAALERVLGQLSLQQRDTGTLRGDLLFLAESVAAFLTQPAGRALARAVFAEDVAPSIAALARRQLEESAAGPAAAMVMRARSRGEWRDDADPLVVLPMLVGAILHRTTLERSPPNRRWREHVVDVLLGGVAPPKPRRGA
jgi:AcrR family transcriptional regulator